MIIAFSPKIVFNNFLIASDANITNITNY